MWINNGEVSSYVAKSTVIPEGWKKGRLPKKSTEDERFKLKYKSKRCIVLETPHFCAMNKSEAIRLYVEYYGMSPKFCAPIECQDKVLTDRYYEERKDIVTIFGLTKNDIGSTFSEIIPIIQKPQRWLKKN